MIVFFFSKCVAFSASCNLERMDWNNLRAKLTDLWIFYFCVCQLISSSNWVLETASCVVFYIFAASAMTYHMRDPVSTEEAATFIPENQVTYQILLASFFFFAFSTVNRFVIERRERITYLAKITVQQQHL